MGVEYMDFEIKRSNRKKLTLEVSEHGVLVRAPLWVSDADIHAFVQERRQWIEEHLALIQEQLKQEAEEPTSRLTAADLHLLATQAAEYIPQRVSYYARLLGVRCKRIAIRNQRTRWGSCSNKGNLNFNCLMMLTPPEVRDSIIVHELCHLKEPNHSEQFYAEVLRVCPQYWEHHAWLKENSGWLLAMLGR